PCRTEIYPLSLHDALPILGFIAEILQFTTDVVKLKQRTINGELEVREVEQIVNQLSQTIKETEKEINELTKKQIETTVLINIGDWFSKKHYLVKELSLQEEKNNQLNNEIQLIKNDLINDQINVSKFEEDTKTLNDDFLQQKKELTTKLQSYQV